MAKNFIGKALTRLCQAEGGLALCDRIAKQLHRMSDAQVNGIDKALDFGWLKLTMRGTGSDTPAEDAALRRAAMLVQRTILLTAATKTDAESWDSGRHREVIQAGRGGADPAMQGFYLKGSFWAFSDHSERAWTRAAWSEAENQVRAALRVCSVAQRNGSTEQQNVVRRYFGSTPPSVLEGRLVDLQRGMQQDLVGICYQGSGRQPEGDYRENEGGGAVQGEVVGWASAQAAGFNNIGFQARFYKTSTTATARTALHTFTPKALEITRGGAIVHELSHRYLQTIDTPIGSDMTEFWTYLNTPYVAGVQAFGPRGCNALARSYAGRALGNADTYRLFCEDALFS